MGLLEQWFFFLEQTQQPIIQYIDTIIVKYV